MNPDNNALERTYFIGGPPRVGKSLLAYKLAKKISGHVVSTDAIRSAAKKACENKDSDLFILNRESALSDSEWKRLYRETPEKVIDNQNRESRAFWNSTVSFCNSFCEDDEMHIVEGVALLPELVSTMEHKPQHVLYIGNCSDRHLESMMKYASDFPEQDWMASMKYDEEKIEGMARFIKTMSLYFKNEAEKYGFPYYEVEDVIFEISLNEIVRDITR